MATVNPNTTVLSLKNVLKDLLLNLYNFHLDSIDIKTVDGYDLFDDTLIDHLEEDTILVISERHVTPQGYPPHNVPVKGLGPLKSDLYLDSASFLSNDLTSNYSDRCSYDNDGRKNIPFSDEGSVKTTSSSKNSNIVDIITPEMRFITPTTYSLIPINSINKIKKARSKNNDSLLTVNSSVAANEDDKESRKLRSNNRKADDEYSMASGSSGVMGQSTKDSYTGTNTTM